MKIDKIKSVHSEDIEKYLESLGVLEDIRTGKALCSFCNTKITLKNIICIYPEDNQVKFCCDTPGCYESLIQKRGRING